MDKNFKIFVIIALVALASLAATATVVAFNVMNKSNQAAKAEAEGGEEETVKKENTELLPLAEAITANLAGEEDGYHIIRVQISLCIDSKAKTAKDFKEKFAAEQVTIRDAVIRVLRQQTYEMVMKQDAQDKIGEQLTNTLNTLLETDIIQGVYFGDFFVQ